MEVIRNASEDEMVLALLQAEIDAERFQLHVAWATGGDRNLVLNAALNDAAANRRRSDALSLDPPRLLR